jgi:hypothetical protein
VRDGFLPRIVGMHETTLRGVAFERDHDAVHDVDGAAGDGRVPRASRGGPAAVDAEFAGTGIEELLAYVPRWRVRRNPCRLMLERP